MTDNIHWEFLPVGSPGQFEPRWDEFNARTLRTPLLDSAFVRMALRHFGSGNEQFAVASDAKGTAAMCLLRMRGPAIVETFQPSQLPLGAWLQRSDISFSALAASLVRDHAGTTALAALTRLDPRLVARPADGPLLQTLKYITTGAIELGDTLEQYMARRSGNLLANLRRRQRNVEHEYGAISLQVLELPDDVEAGIIIYSDLESAGWKAKVGTAISKDGLQWRFYVDAMTAFCRQAQGRVFVLRFGDQIAAAAMAVIVGSIAYMLKTTHNERLRSCSPGIFLRREVIESLHRREPRIDRIEIYGPLNAAQMPWITETREMYHANAYRTRAIAGLHSFSKRLRRLAVGKDTEAALPSPRRPTSPLRIAAVDRFEAIPRQARASLECDEAHEVFYSLAWFQLMASEVFAVGATPRLLHAMVERGDRSAQMLLPMVSAPAAQRWFGARRLQSLANYYSSLFGPVSAGVADDDLESLVTAVAEFVADTRPEWDVIDLHPLDVSSAFWEVVQRALRSQGFWTDSYACFGNWYLPVIVSTFEEYMAGRPSQLKSALKSGSKRIFRDPSANLTIVDAAGPELQRAIEAYELTYARSWKYSEPYPNFVPRLCELAARKNWLRLGILRIGDKPAAAQVWLVKDGKASIYKVAYDEEFAKLSPGTVLTAALMKHVIEVDKVHEVDYLVGDDAYKRGWMSHRRQRRGIVAFNPRTVWGLAHAAAHFGGKVVQTTRRRLKAIREAATPGDATSGNQGEGTGPGVESRGST